MTAAEVVEPVSLAEQVSKLLSGISTIGEGRDVIELTGSLATIVANRITVDHEVVAQYVSLNGHAFWHVYAIDGTPPVWVVGAKAAQGNWLGAID